MLLKINLKNHLIASSSIFLLTLGYFLLMLFFKFDNGIIIICSIAFLLFVFPGIYLHFEYWYINKNESIILTQDSLSVKRRYEVEIYSVNEIKKIVVYGSATLFKPWFHLSAMEQYHFARIFLKNGEFIIISCLMASRIDKSLESLKNVTIEKKNGLFNSTFIN